MSAPAMPDSTAASIPLIRMDDYHSHPTRTIQRLRDACTNVGFFYLQGHSIDARLIDSVFAQSKKLFCLPEACKRRLSDHVLSRGYTALEEETLDPAVQLLRGDTKEGYYIGRDIPPDDDRYDVSKLRGPNVWPTPETTTSWSRHECDEFRRIMTDYQDQMSQLSRHVVQLLALAMGLDDSHYFDASFDEPMASLRLLHYPPVASDPSQGVFACGAHSDYGMITLLLIDHQQQEHHHQQQQQQQQQEHQQQEDNQAECYSAGGLQLQSLDGAWRDAPPLDSPYTIIVNLGDMLERWTNGTFRSTRHRVVMNAQQGHRYSMPFFFEPSFDAVVKCLSVCCSDERPAKYAATTAGEHLLSKYKATHKDFKPV